MRTSLILSALALGAVASTCHPRDKPDKGKPDKGKPGKGDGDISADYTTFDNRVIFETPPSTWTDPRVLYARALELSDGRLLSTWENYSPEPPAVHFPIYESSDHGASWEELSQVHDDVNGWGMRYQPDLFELPEAVGGFPKGTIMVSGNSIPTDLSETKIDIYASRDGGKSWEFVSSVASGGRADPVNWETPVWEPHMIYHNGEIILYYADQRPENHGQVISHQTSTDLLTWSDVVIDVIYDDPDARPGMPAVAQLPNDSYIYLYEYGGAPGFEHYTFETHYRIASDPREFADAPDYPVEVEGSDVTSTSSPFVVWTPWGGDNGTIVVSASQGQVWANKALGAPDAWTIHDTPQPGAYSRGLMTFEDRPDLLLMIGAGLLPPSSSNEVSLSVVDLEEMIGSE